MVDFGQYLKFKIKSAQFSFVVDFHGSFSPIMADFGW